MNQSKHTPAPWSTTKIGAQVRDASKRIIAFIAHYGMSAEERGANARLIAAAPDLLAACELVVDTHNAFAIVREINWEKRGQQPRSDPPYIKACRAAIARATEREEAQ